MSGLTSRNKGKRAEREIVHLLQPIINEVYAIHKIEPVNLQRNTLQSDRGGCDLVGLDWLSPEVKHQEARNLSAWWEQTCEQAKAHQTPVLFYRCNHAPWRVRMRGVLHCPTANPVHAPALVDISIDDFLTYFRMRLAWQLSQKR